MAVAYRRFLASDMSCHIINTDEIQTANLLFDAINVIQRFADTRKQDGGLQLQDDIFNFLLGAINNYA